ncbi:MAG TPA: PilZ domain-containing protein [Kofleriaceae bacterium]|jgi:hypothetical protein|nr:PilZ domain-containing protein [Kofleriaceae bacterium]
MPEKRAAQRIPVRLRAQYRSTGIIIDGEVESLSRTGLFMRADLLDTPGTEAVLVLDLPGSEGPLELPGEVVRVDHRPGRSGMGIRFGALVDTARRPLANFMIESSYSTLR